MNSYELTRKFVDFSFENPSKIKPNHYALYFFAIEHCNRLGWKKEFGLPTTMTMEAIGIKSYNTYIKTFNDLAEFGFIKIIERSKNQYSSNIIALSNFNKALDKALDKAFIKHGTKHCVSTEQSIDSIIKQINNKQLNNKQINKLKDALDNFKSQYTKEKKEDLFNIFWSKYPKKVAKEKSKNIFLKLSQTEIDKILATIDNFISFKPFKEYNHPNPTTYLNQKRWNDELGNKTDIKFENLKPLNLTSTNHIKNQCRQPKLLQDYIDRYKTTPEQLRDYIKFRIENNFERTYEI